MYYEFLPFNLSDGLRNPDRVKVLLIPGFLAGDASLFPLAFSLRALGCRTFFPGIWCNIDCSERAMDGLCRVLSELHQHDNRKLVLIGHSLGGIYARELARRFPHSVERIFLLGSAIDHPLDHTNPYVRMLFVASRSLHEDGRRCLEHLATMCGANPGDPPPVPETIIYSRRDQVVDWRSCIESGVQVETLEVNSGHWALAYHPKVFAIIAERLGNHVPKAIGKSSVRLRGRRGEHRRSVARSNAGIFRSRSGKHERLLPATKFA